MVASGDYTPSILVTAVGFVAVFILVRLFASKLGAGPSGLASLKALCLRPVHDSSGEAIS
jgi:hypothetical protein